MSENDYELFIGFKRVSSADGFGAYLPESFLKLNTFVYFLYHLSRHLEHALGYPNMTVAPFENRVQRRLTVIPI